MQQGRATDTMYANMKSDITCQIVTYSAFNREIYDILPTKLKLERSKVFIIHLSKTA